VGRHRHAVNVRADGLAAVLGPLLRDSRVRAAALVDVDSGMLLDAYVADRAGPDPEMLGAGHAELMRVARAVLHGSRPYDSGYEVVLSDAVRHHLLRIVPDPHGDRLALSVVVDGPPRVLDRIRKRLRAVSADALTAGPTVTRRPVEGGWVLPSPERAPQPWPHTGPPAPLPPGSSGSPEPSAGSPLPVVSPPMSGPVSPLAPPPLLPPPGPVHEPADPAIMTLDVGQAPVPRPAGTGPSAAEPPAPGPARPRPSPSPRGDQRVV
jgi:hypothetical protein